MQRSDVRFRALGSPCELHLYGESKDALEHAAALAVGEVERIEQKYSRYREDTIVSEINRAAGSGRFVSIDAETDALLDYAATTFEQSDGLFDITSGVLRAAWDFASGRLPDQATIDGLLPQVGWSKVLREAGRVRLAREGMEIDFGGFGKEYAVDRVTVLLREQGVTAGLVDLGGDLSIVGPHPDGQPWIVGIRDPRDPENAMASLPLSHGALATSGDYERFMEIDGQRYCHLLDPRTGWPVRGLASTSVVAPQCLVAGSGTTIGMLKGKQGAAWLDRLGLPHLWVREDGERGGSLWPRRGGTKPRGLRATPAP